MYTLSCVLLAAALVPTTLSHFATASAFGNNRSNRAPPNTNMTVVAPQYFPEHKSERIKVSYGPYTVPSMDNDNGMKQFGEASMPLPCTDCLITWMQAGLEYADGTVANASNGMWLHHTVFTNLNRLTPVCPTGRDGGRFFASGNERTPVNICVSGYVEHPTWKRGSAMSSLVNTLIGFSIVPAGYYVGPRDEIAMRVELMNMADEPRAAILTMTYEFIPSVPKGFSKVKSYWLDIGGCISSSFPAQPDSAFQYSSPPWKSNSAGRVTFIGSHLHDGGTHTEVTKNGKIICDSEATYGSIEQTNSLGTGMDHIMNISQCTDLGATELDDEWSITAYYDTSKHLPMANADGSLEPIMGISLVYVAEIREIHYEHRLRNNVLTGGLLASVIALVLLWYKMRGGRLGGIFLRKNHAVALDAAEAPMLPSEYNDDD